jgi:hypothetical protein
MFMCPLDLTPRYSVKEGIAQLRYNHISSSFLSIGHILNSI